MLISLFLSLLQRTDYPDVECKKGDFSPLQRPTRMLGVSIPDHEISPCLTALALARAHELSLSFFLSHTHTGALRCET